MGFRKSLNEAPQAVCCNCGLQTDQKTVEERSADSLERQAPCADAFCGGPFPGFERVKTLSC